MIAAREVHREYVALAYGRVPEEMVVDVPLRRDLISRIKMAVLATGKPSRTDVYLLGQGEEDRRSISAVHCVLHSGRTHQIRVHMAHRRHPLLGDALYGGGFRTKAGRLSEAAQSELDRLGRQALRAAPRGLRAAFPSPCCRCLPACKPTGSRSHQLAARRRRG